ncbi:hypothetical protein AVEN_240406-1 [Araneus ventricosus]|uniref:Uncharacterized protein n=1 Tax=Araneus ventricosus TaxID=182803 RepID=A0A4Y2GZI0_ARAVE|nr:hypothetical protein AVEN_240406-1 [Araneus ventricosus]
MLRIGLNSHFTVKIPSRGHLGNRRENYEGENGLGVTSFLREPIMIWNFGSMVLFDVRGIYMYFRKNSTDIREDIAAFHFYFAAYSSGDIKSLNLQGRRELNMQINDERICLKAPAKLLCSFSHLSAPGRSVLVGMQIIYTMFFSFIPST